MARIPLRQRRAEKLKAHMDATAPVEEVVEVKEKSKPKKATKKVKKKTEEGE